MSAKDVKFDTNARSKLIKGVNTLADDPQLEENARISENSVENWTLLSAQKKTVQNLLPNGPCS